jgi:hypothetical protein
MYEKMGDAKRAATTPTRSLTREEIGNYQKT